MARYGQVHPLLVNISWEITQPPENAKLLLGPTMHKRPISEQDWQQVMLPGLDFSIFYPFARYGEFDTEIPYEAGGQPITLLDLLTTIYEFYQEPIPANELAQLLEDETTYTPDMTRRIDAMLGLVFIESLTPVGNDGYQLNLAS